MKVYCLFHGFWSDRSLWGIYDSLEGAMAEHTSGHKAAWKLSTGGLDDPQERHWSCQAVGLGWPGCEFAIEERVLQRSEVNVA